MLLELQDWANTGATGATGSLGTFWDEDGSGNFLPASDNLYDIGSSTKRVKDLYLGPNTLYFSSGGVDYPMGGLGTISEGTIGIVSTTPTKFTNQLVCNGELECTSSINLAGGRYYKSRWVKQPLL